MLCTGYLTQGCWVRKNYEKIGKTDKFTVYCSLRNKESVNTFFVFVSLLIQVQTDKSLTICAFLSPRNAQFACIYILS